MVASAILISDISDHLPIVTWMDLKPTKAYKTDVTKLSRLISDEAILTFRNLLSDSDLPHVSSLCEDNKPNLSYDLLIQTFMGM